MYDCRNAVVDKWRHNGVRRRIASGGELCPRREIRYRRAQGNFGCEHCIAYVRRVARHKQFRNDPEWWWGRHHDGFCRYENEVDTASFARYAEFQEGLPKGSPSFASVRIRKASSSRASIGAHVFSWGGFVPFVPSSICS